METAMKVLSRLEERFPETKGIGSVPGARRVFLEIPMDKLLETIRFCQGELGFDHLCTITGLDTGEAFEFIYHIANGDGIVLNLKMKTERGNTLIPSVMSIYNGAIFYELELEGLLGVEVEGLPEDRQYPLPDNWPKGQYPLRKDWKPGQAQSNP